jgi:flavin-dependent dehydrogenase
MTNINILGAGPAGLSAAINLAKAGYNVDVFEKNADVGSRFHNDFQGLENWSDKKDTLELFEEMGIDINLKYNPFYELKICNGSKIWDIKCNRPAFYLVKRGSKKNTLDQTLKNHAMDLGVNIHFNETIPENESDIIATGPIKSEICAAAKGITFETSSPNLAVGLLNNNAALKGYSYLLIADGQGCMSTVFFKDFNNANSYFEETKKIFNDKFDLNLKETGYMGGIGCFSSRNIFRNGKSLYIGEAAGIQDFLWGFGIKNAVTSGYLAARSIINGEDYEKYAERYFRKKLNAGLVNRYLWEKFGFMNYSFIVNRIHGAKDPLKFLNYFYNANFIHKMLYPFARRHLQRKYKNLRI